MSIQVFSFSQTSVIEKDTSLIDLVIDFGKTYIGTQYKYGSCRAENGFDCSGFLYFIFKMGGLDIPRSSKSMSFIGEAKELFNLQKGDLLFFDTYNKGTISHVGIISEIDNERIVMLHVSSSKGVQEIDIIQSNYWYARFQFGISLDK